MRISSLRLKPLPSQKLDFTLIFIPSVGIKCSQVGNVLFPRWEYFIDLLLSSCKLADEEDDA